MKYPIENPRFPNESKEYRRARQDLLEAEAELRQQMEDEAALRRQLPLGGGVDQDYVFDEIGENGEVRQVKLSELFAPGKDSLLLYGFMFGPEMAQACPMCTSILDGLEGNAQHISQRINLAVVARSPIERIQEFSALRGWKRLRLLSSANNRYQADYHAEAPDGNQWPMANVFVRRDGATHHFWGSELMFREFEGGNQRHVDQIWPLWNVLDLTPEGRGDTWYPSLGYSG
jgi:predicted dithiol-disulfide oxidoreductase (DUF899 family)